MGRITETVPARRSLPLAVLILAALPAGSAAGENWPHWRGPAGTGVSPEKDLPVRWSEGRNIAWKAGLRGMGVSSPVVWEDRIFVTSQLGRGRVREGDHPTLSRGAEATEQALGGGQTGGGTPDPTRVRFVVHAFNRSDGSRAWEAAVQAARTLPEVHSKHNLATPSCTTDGRGVYCWFGTGQLVAISMAGAMLWQKNLARDYQPFDVSWGHSSSPTLYGDTLFLLCDHATSAYLLALDKNSGEEKWKVDRGSSLRGYSTPMIMRGPPRDELIINSNRGVDAYDPATGERLWFFEEQNRFPVPSPSAGDGMIVMSRGYRSGPYMAIRPGGSGDISDSHVRWRVATGAPYVSSVVYYEGLMYMVNDSGVVTCADGKTGQTVWKARIGGVYSASPVAGDGKVYFSNEGCRVTVVRAGREAEILAQNELGERCLASPAISGGRLYIRTDRHLYSIGR